MDDAKGLMAMIAKGLVISVAYGFSYLVLRHFSFDQWFLPAGLRAACLFFLPIRYWPFIFIGDAAAVMYGRIPKAHKYDPLWVYAGPLLLIASGSIAPYLLRKKLRNTEMIVRRLPIAAACTAAWSAICTISFNVALGGPNDFSMMFFANNVFGNYLGIFMVVLPALIWMRRHQYTDSLNKTLRDAALALSAVAAMFAYLKFLHSEDNVVRTSVLMLMICPALFLTYYHGWLGAAIGVVLVNLGIAQTMTYVRIPGAPVPYDETVFLAQIGLSIAASAFLILGTRITSHYEKAIDAGAAEEEARRISRLTLLSNAGESRNQVLYMAQLHVLIDEEMRELVPWLKAQGKYTEAQAVNTRVVRHRELFNKHALGLYPVGIEEKGLFAVVHSQAFEDRWSEGVPLIIRFDDGDPKMLSNDLQFSAYHALCSAIVLMGDWKPEEFHIRVRVWRTLSHRGVYFTVSAFNPGEAEVSQAGAAASLLLNARASAHGGIVRRHAHRVSVLLSEANIQQPD
ncbi:MAG TPA: MASE1 domain-containing protein [Xanthomonadaceae bacterium]